MTRPIACFVAILLLTLSIYPLAAQAQGDGPVSFSLTAKVEHTDNRDSVADEDSNTDYYISPRVDVLFDNERTILDLFYSPSYRHRDNPSDVQNDDEWQHDLGADLKHEINSRSMVWLNERFNYTDDPEIKDGGATLRRDSTYTLNRVSVGANNEFNRLTLGTFNVRHKLKRYEEDARADASDEDELVGEAALYRQVARDLAIKATAGVSTFGYEDPADLNRDFMSIYGYLGVEKVFTEHLQGGIDVGLTAIDYDSDELDSMSIPYGRAYLQANTMPSRRFNVSASYQQRNSDVYPFASQETLELRGDIEADVSEAFTLGVAGVYRTAEYDEETLEAGAAAVQASTGRDTSGDETTVQLSAFARLAITDDTSIKLTQRYEDVDSDVDQAFTRNSTQLALSHEF